MTLTDRDRERASERKREKEREKERHRERVAGGKGGGGYEGAFVLLPLPSLPSLSPSASYTPAIYRRCSPFRDIKERP